MTLRYVHLALGFKQAVVEHLDNYWTPDEILGGCEGPAARRNPLQPLRQENLDLRRVELLPLPKTLKRARAGLCNLPMRLRKQAGRCSARCLTAGTIRPNFIEYIGNQDNTCSALIFRETSVSYRLDSDHKKSGPEESRTPGLCNANAALYQLSYRPLIFYDLACAIPQDWPLRRICIIHNLR